MIISKSILRTTIANYECEDVNGTKIITIMILILSPCFHYIHHHVHGTDILVKIKMIHM